MRTTLTLDDEDMAALLERLRKSRNNIIKRCGLAWMETSTIGRR